MFHCWINPEPGRRIFIYSVEIWYRLRIAGLGILPTFSIDLSHDHGGYALRHCLGTAAWQCDCHLTDAGLDQEWTVSAQPRDASS